MGGWFLYGEYKDKNCDCVLKKYRHSTYTDGRRVRTVLNVKKEVKYSNI